MPSKTRAELKQYFVKNAIPTEGNFADLIDSPLNQSDDGLFKQPGQPLAVVSTGGDQQRVLQLYAAYPAANPDWLLSLNPRHPTASTGNLAGLGIADGAGNTRLVLDTKGNLTVTGDVTATGRGTFPGGITAGPVQASGNGGVVNIEGSDHAYIQWYSMKVASGRKGWIGYDGANTTTMTIQNDAGVLALGGSRVTVGPGLSVGNGLEVTLPAGTDPWNRFIVNTTNLWGDAGNQYATIGAGGAAGIMFYNPHVVWYAPDNRASIRYGRTGGRAGDTWWDAGVRADGGFSFTASDNGGAGEVLKISKNGDTYIKGNLTVQGKQQNIIKVVTIPRAVINAGVDTPAKWNVTYSGFSQVYAVFIVLQGFSVFPNNNVNFTHWGHAPIVEGIPQHVFVRVDNFDITTAQGVAYCSESGKGETDNSILFTVVVMGRGNQP
jgi:hypothetical protein